MNSTLYYGYGTDWGLRDPKLIDISKDFGKTMKSLITLGIALTLIAGAVKKGDKVALVGFGTFAVAKRAKRNGINPATKKAIVIPAKKVLKFKASATLLK